MADYKPGDLEYPEQDDRKQFFRYHYKGVIIFCLPFLLLPIAFMEPPKVFHFTYVTFVIYLYYVSNVLPTGALAWFYIVILPIWGMTSSAEICGASYTDIMFLLVASIWIAIMFESSKLNIRLGLRFIKLFGANLTFLMVPMMLMVFILSIPISSTFITAIFMKIAQAIVAELGAIEAIPMTNGEETFERGQKPYPSFPVIGFYLSICYAATLGGMISTFQDPTGTFYNALDRLIPDKTQNPLGFMVVMFVPAIVGLIVAYLWLNIIFQGLFFGPIKTMMADFKGNRNGSRDAARGRLEEIGPITIYEILAFVMIIIAVVAIILRRPLLFSGYYDMLVETKMGGSVPGMMVIFLLFAIPANYYFCRYYVCKPPQVAGTSPSLLGWKAVHSGMPWGDIFFLASALSFPYGLKKTKTLEYIYKNIYESKGSQGGVMMVSSIWAFIFTTLSPATAVANHILPTFFKLGYKMGVGRGAPAMAFAMQLHNQFLLPCSTPPNTVVAGFGNIRPFLFLLGGLLPAIVSFLLIWLFVGMMAESSFDGCMENDKDTTLNFTYL